MHKSKDFTQNALYLIYSWFILGSIEHLLTDWQFGMQTMSLIARKGKDLSRLND